MCKDLFNSPFIAIPNGNFAGFVRNYLMDAFVLEGHWLFGGDHY
jgi:hypothetical protein